VNSVYLLDISLTSKNIGAKTGPSAQEILQMMELSPWIKTVPVWQFFRLRAIFHAARPAV